MLVYQGPMENLEQYFKKFRDNVVGIDQEFETPYGIKKMVYADWIASGRLYKPIEDRMLNDIAPFIGNTHTETTETGTLMTKAYQYAHKLIKEHVNAVRVGVRGTIHRVAEIIGSGQHDRDVLNRLLTKIDFTVVVEVLPDQANDFGIANRCLFHVVDGDRDDGRIAKCGQATVARLDGQRVRVLDLVV